MTNSNNKQNTLQILLIIIRFLLKLNYQEAFKVKLYLQHLEIELLIVNFKEIKFKPAEALIFQDTLMNQN